MRHSESIGELVAALAKAQAEFGPAFKETDNPAFGARGRYADLASIISAIRAALNKHGIFVSQINGSDLERQTASVETILFCGEQWISSEVVEAPAIGRGEKFDIQSIGACWTYLRRYTLQSLLGVAAEEDDDGNSLQNENKPIPARKLNPRPTTTRESAQTVEHRAAAAPEAAKPQAGNVAFIPPNGLTCTVKSVRELSAEKLADIAKRKGRAWLTVEFLGQHNGVSEMSCFDTKYWDLLKSSVGLECHFQIAERDKDGRHYINVEDVVYVDGVEHVDGKPVVQGEQQ